MPFNRLKQDHGRDRLQLLLWKLFWKCVSLTQICLNRNQFHLTFARKSVSEIYLNTFLPPSLCHRNTSFPHMLSPVISRCLRGRSEHRVMKQAGLVEDRAKRIAGNSQMQRLWTLYVFCNQSVARPVLAPSLWKQKLITTDEKLSKAFICPT